MASIVVAGDTSGTCTISAPAVAGTPTLTLPTTSGTLATLTTPSFATTIGVGGATPSTSGAGITFPATQSASSDANTLDDYEEGTWTPAWLNFGTGTYDVQQGRYTKIGRLVTIECYLGILSLGSASGNAIITGLPFVPVGTVATPQMWTNNWASSGQNIVALGGGSTQLTLFILPSSSGVTQATMSNMTTSSNIVFTLSYAV